MSDLSIDDEMEAIELDTTFMRNSIFPGTVKIVVEATTFWLVQHQMFVPALKLITEIKDA